jgi:predicted RNA-binding Zn-ribbon protein involved in translation (DUF1610 family)
MSEEMMRCPYCVMDSEFRPMLRQSMLRRTVLRQSRRKWFVCVSCGHTATPDDPYAKCSCSRCREMKRIADRCRSLEHLRRREGVEVPVRL